MRILFWWCSDLCLKFGLPPGCELSAFLDPAFTKACCARLTSHSIRLPSVLKQSRGNVCQCIKATAEIVEHFSPPPLTALSLNGCVNIKKQTRVSNLAVRCYFYQSDIGKHEDGIWTRSKTIENFGEQSSIEQTTTGQNWAQQRHVSQLDQMRFGMDRLDLYPPCTCRSFVA